MHCLSYIQIEMRNFPGGPLENIKVMVTAQVCQHVSDETMLKQAVSDTPPQNILPSPSLLPTCVPSLHCAVRALLCSLPFCSRLNNALRLRFTLPSACHASKRQRASRTQDGETEIVLATAFDERPLSHWKARLPRSFSVVFVSRHHYDHEFLAVQFGIVTILSL